MLGGRKGFNNGEEAVYQPCAMEGRREGQRSCSQLLVKPVSSTASGRPWKLSGMASEVSEWAQPAARARPGQAKRLDGERTRLGASEEAGHSSLQYSIRVGQVQSFFAASPC